MEFRGNTTSWTLMAPSEFLFNKKILKFCQLMVYKFKGKEMHQTISLKINCAIIGNMHLKRFWLIAMFLFFLFNWNSLHSRLNSQPLQGMDLQEKEAKKD